MGVGFVRSAHTFDSSSVANETGRINRGAANSRKFSFVAAAMTVLANPCSHAFMDDAYTLQYCAVGIGL